MRTAADPDAGLPLVPKSHAGGVRPGAIWAGVRHDLAVLLRRESAGEGPSPAWDPTMPKGRASFIRLRQGVHVDRGLPDLLGFHLDIYGHDDSVQG